MFQQTKWMMTDLSINPSIRVSSDDIFLFLLSGEIAQGIWTVLTFINIQRIWQFMTMNLFTQFVRLLHLFFFSLEDPNHASFRTTKTSRTYRDRLHPAQLPEAFDLSNDFATEFPEIARNPLCFFQSQRSFHRLFQSNGNSLFKTDWNNDTKFYLILLFQ